MTISKYEELTGSTVSSANKPKYLAKIRRTKKILESMLGYTLGAGYDTNYYTETGKTQTDFPHPDDNLNLDPADAVIGAYRLYGFNDKDVFYHIDPASAIHKLKVVRNGVTYFTFATDQYAPTFDRGIIKYIQQHYQLDYYYHSYFYTHFPYFNNYYDDDHGLQLAVDATWLWSDVDSIPEDILDVWVDMIDYYVDSKVDIKTQTLGSHSYTKFDKAEPQYRDYNMAILKEYAGPMGTLNKTITI